MQKPFMCAGVGFVQPIRDVLGSYRRRVGIGTIKSRNLFLRVSRGRFGSCMFGIQPCLRGG